MGLFGGGDEMEARPVITDQGGVTSNGNLQVVDSSAEVVDLLCEGVMEGLVSGSYAYNGTQGDTGFYETGFTPYITTGTSGTLSTELGFLRSVYWNDLPVVDQNGYYNYSSINVEYHKGDPEGKLPELRSDLPANETLDLTVERPIGERLYGLSTQGGSYTSNLQGLADSAAVDTVAKTYTILNKECTTVEVRIKVTQLFEQIRNEDAPRDQKKGRKPAPVGYGDIKARSIEYYIYWQPMFDDRFNLVSSTSTPAADTTPQKWHGPRREKITGNVEQVYIRNSKIHLNRSGIYATGPNATITDYTIIPGFVGWRIKIIRITPESLTAYLKNQSYVDSLVEIYGTKLRYPYSSMVYSKFDAEFFNRIPSRSYDTRLIKVKVPNNYDPIKKTYGISDAIDVGAVDRRGNPVVWPQNVKVKSRLKTGQVVTFEGGAKLYLTGDTPDITYPATFYQEVNTHSLLHFDGANGDQSTVDSSTYPIQITLNADAELSTTQKKFGTSSLYLGGIGDNATLGANDGSSFAWSNSSWGIECWVRPASGSFSAVQMIFDSSGVIYLQINTDGKVVLRNKKASDSSEFATITTTQALTVDTWHHIAAVRNGNDFKVYIDGTSYGNATASDTIKTATAASTIGEYEGGSSQYFKGYMDEFRIPIGEAPYTANFTPATTAFPNPYKITNYGALTSGAAYKFGIGQGVHAGTPNHADPVFAETGATTEGYSGTTEVDNFWDGGFKQVSVWPEGAAVATDTDPLIIKEWTDNPAWCFYDLLTNPRYGLGEYINEPQVDKWALYEIAQYCDVLVPDGYGSIEPRFTMNHIITSREEAYQAVNNLASVFRGIAYYANGLIFAVQDSFKKPLYQFNNTNVVEGNFAYSSSSKKARHSVAIVRYIDKHNLFVPAVEYVENEESIKRYGIRQIETSALGVTSRGQARRLGQWVLASEAEETESVTFTVGQDGAYMRPGDVVQIYDQYRTPLKLGGRTNSVIGTGVAPSSIDWSNPPEDQNGSITGNSVIIDNVVEFTTNQVYKFSLLTPTYNYESSDVSDLDSNSITEIRRSQLQTLYFEGSHALSVTGYYKSDYEEGGSGIATQIYFHTGLIVEGGEPIGTGNQLDFDNYVITGYTNNYVQGPDAPIIMSYSGGCFSGENLVWSVEPNNPSAPEFISGNLSNYRIINVAENDEDTTYNISALAYASGKYDKVENRLKFDNPIQSQPPIWPYYEKDNNYYAWDAVKIEKAGPHTQQTNPASLPLTSNEKDKFNTLEVTIPQAGLKTKTPKLMSEGGRYSYEIDESESSLVVNAMSYGVFIYEQLALDDVGTHPPFGDINLKSELFTAERGSTLLWPVSDDQWGNYKNREFITINGNPGQKIANGGNAIPSDGNLSAFFAEEFLNKDTNYWVAVFAFNNQTRSAKALIGLIPASNSNIASDQDTTIGRNQIQKDSAFSFIDGINVTSLTSADLIGDTQIAGLNQLSSTQPSFSWDAASEYTLADDYNQLMDIPSYHDYRITIRKHDSNLSPNTPSNEIYVEITGYKPTEGSFVFLRDYNSPHVVEDLPSEVTAGRATLTNKNGHNWYTVEESGIIFRGDKNSFPLREFDIVVEAHDPAGLTSAGNNVGDNTILGQKDTYTDGAEGYQKMSCNIGIPSGIVFAQGDSSSEVDALDDYFFLTPSQAYTRKYPYVAKAALYNNGTLNLSIEPSTDKAGNRILNETQLSNSFPDVRGVVYYYSTGDNTLIDERVQTDQGLGEVIFNPKNKAPKFTFYPDNIPTSQILGYQGEVNYMTAADEFKQWRESNPNAPGVAHFSYTESKNSNAAFQSYRNFYVFDNSTDAANITIPFPDIGEPSVQNIQLTIALFDSLTYFEHFNSDGTPKTTTINNSAYADPNTDYPYPAWNGNELIPTLFTERNMNFSTLPQKIYSKGDTGTAVEWRDKDFGPSAEGSQIFLKERSLQTQGQDALAYRAWFDITLDPGERKLIMDFDKDEKLDHTSYRGGHLRQKNGTVALYPKKNKLKGFSKMVFEEKLLYDTGVTGTHKWFLYGGYLSLYFDDKVGFDPEQYTVDVEFSQTDLASAYLAANTYKTVKISDSRDPLAEENQLNPNTRDFVASSTNLPLCHLYEKGRGYVKFYLEPFMLKSYGTEIIERMQSGQCLWVVQAWFVGNSDFAEYPNPRMNNENPRQLVYERENTLKYGTQLYRQRTIRLNDFYPYEASPNKWYNPVTANFEETVTYTNFLTGADKVTKSANIQIRSYIWDTGKKRWHTLEDGSTIESNVLVWGKPYGTTITWSGGLVNGKGEISGTSTQTLKLPSVAGNEAMEALSAGQKAVAVGNYINDVEGITDTDTKTNKQAFLGNIIKLRGGILLSDKHGGKVNSGE